MSNPEKSPTIPDPPSVPSAVGNLSVPENISIDTSASDNDSESTGSLPDLEPVTDSDHSASAGGHVNADGAKMHHPTPIVTIDPRSVNSNAQTLEINHRQIFHNGPSAFGNHAMGPSSPNWRGPGYLVERAFRDAFADRVNHPGFVQGGPAGNYFRRGGAPYQVQAGRGLNAELINDLIWRLQRVEHALRGLAEQHYWAPHPF
ncbi:hypothetical protein B0H13DRAFT_2558162 [Mycena leptocephala]|nr:hypothetical protein B0H13DRAFT_2558162 [Mycena leptocephala]